MTVLTRCNEQLSAIDAHSISNNASYLTGKDADMPPISDFLIVAGGGAIGSVLRYMLAIGSARLPGGTTLAGTLVANLLGCFSIGLLVAIVSQYPDWISVRTVTGIRVGLLGGLTTFSTFAAESVALGSQGRTGWMVAYMIASVGLGLMAVSLGMAAIQPIQPNQESIQ